MLMERLLLDSMIKWKNKKRRKPLVIHGARQVGKTWLMKEFGRRFFDDFVYISFDNNDRMRQVFDLDYDIRRILSALKIESGKKIEPENTLIIFDEIQEAPKAMAALKYFCEDAPEYYIVAAGSLLGMALHKETSFPVGKVEFMSLYPFNFREFLMAAGENGLAEMLIQQDFDFLNSYHEKYTDLLRKYYYIGGMPEAIQTFLDTDDTREVRKVQKDLLLY